MQGAGPRLAVLPDGLRDWLGGAVRAGGGRVVPPDQAEALVWASPDDVDGLAEVLADHGDHLRWVQLPWAGIEPFVPVLDGARVWTCGKGVYAEPVAELALTLTLAGLRGVGSYARSRSWREHGAVGSNLHGARVVAVGGGAITSSFARMVAPFDVDLVVVRRSPEPFPGAARTVALDALDDELPDAAVVLVAAALTPETEGLFDARRLALMADDAWLVNVARGRHVVTDDLVAALEVGNLGGAALDVTDPEPLPDGHPLWTLPNCIVTPHVGNTPGMAVPLLTARITENVRRWAAGEDLLGPVDVAAGY
ncbi:MAG: NAD(P)-dependent oxidoreductase [Actinomycetes bacterium]